MGSKGFKKVQKGSKGSKRFIKVQKGSKGFKRVQKGSKGHKFHYKTASKVEMICENRKSMTR